MAAHLRPLRTAMACPTPRKSASSACDAASASRTQPPTRAASAALSACWYARSVIRRGVRSSEMPARSRSVTSTRASVPPSQTGRMAALHVSSVSMTVLPSPSRTAMSPLVTTPRSMLAPRAVSGAMQPI